MEDIGEKLPIDWDDARDIKIVIIGPSNAGKTTIVKRIVVGTQELTTYRASLGGNFSSKKILWNDEEPLRLQLWDLAGQDHFASMSHNYYKSAEGCIVVFDSSDEASHPKAKKWKQDLDMKASLADGSLLPTILFSNKVDLKQNDWASAEFLDTFCADNDIIGWFETSAIDSENEGIDAGLLFLIQKILEQSPALEFSPSLSSIGSVDTVYLDNKEGQGNKTNSGCSC